MLKKGPSGRLSAVGGCPPPAGKQAIKNLTYLLGFFYAKWLKARNPIVQIHAQLIIFNYGAHQFASPGVIRESNNQEATEMQYFFYAIFYIPSLYISLSGLNANQAKAK